VKQHRIKAKGVKTRLSAKEWLINEDNRTVGLETANS